MGSRISTYTVVEGTQTCSLGDPLQVKNCSFVYGKEKNGHYSMTTVNMASESYTGKVTTQNSAFQYTLLFSLLTAFFFILQMRELRFRELKHPTQNYMSVG